MSSYDWLKYLLATARSDISLLFSGWILILGIIILTIGVAVTLPTAFWLALNGVSPLFAQQVYTIPAPDSRHVITVSKQVHLPVFDLLDAPTTIAVELRDAENQEVLDAFRFEISDICHLNNPQVEWDGTNIRVKNVETYVERDIILNLPDHTAKLR